MAIVIDGISISDDLRWTDEFTSWRVGQVVRTSVNGRRIVHESALQAGRPITLESVQEGNAYAGVVRLDALRALQASEDSLRPGAFDVVLPAHNAGTRTFRCRWRREGGVAIQARETRFIVPFEDGDWFAVTLRLIQVD